jgi:LAGLIDADG endonuclease.
MYPFVRSLSEIKHNISKLNPWYVTGFSDGDSSFWFSIVPNKKLKIGYEIKPGYSLIAAINSANYNLMLLFDSFFGGIGSIITDHKTNMYEYRIQGFKNCLKVKEHFISYPLISYRLVNFELWCEMLNLIEKKSSFNKWGIKSTNKN